MADCRDDSAVFVECADEGLGAGVVGEAEEGSLASWVEDSAVLCGGEFDAV